MNITNDVSTQDTKNIAPAELNTEALLTMYGEICKSYHANDDFRMKLLGLLPLTSLIGIFGISNTSLFAQAKPIANELIIFIGVFAATFTLALFIYEIRGILRCSNLIKKGNAIERLLKISGQFFVCVAEQDPNQTKPWAERIISVFNAKLAACVIYSTVLAAWIFTVMRFGFDISIYGCVFTAVGFAIVIGVGIFLLVRKLIAA